MLATAALPLPLRLGLPWCSEGAPSRPRDVVSTRLLRIRPFSHPRRPTRGLPTPPPASAVHSCLRSLPTVRSAAVVVAYRLLYAWACRGLPFLSVVGAPKHTRSINRGDACLVPVLLSPAIVG